MSEPPANGGPTVLPGHPGSMPYVGIATFLKLPVTTLASLSELDFAILGIPYDEGTSNRPGARFGPRAIRDASTLYSYEGGVELFDVELGRAILVGARVADFGDVPIDPSDSDSARAAMTGAVRAILEAGATPVCLGGDHSVTASILQAFAGGPVPKPYLVHLDTHMDFDSYLPRHAHGTPIRLAVEGELVTGVTQVGIRGLNSGLADWEEARSLGVNVITCSRFRDEGIAAVLETIPAGAPLYLSIDIDVFDPSAAPGTGTPEPGGLSYVEGRELIRAVAAHGRVQGIDLVEVSPQYDHAQLTSTLAARLLLDTMDAAWSQGTRGR